MRLVVPKLLAALALAGCAEEPPKSPDTLAHPAYVTDLPGGRAVAAALGAYLRTFHLDETNLEAGLSIPWSDLRNGRVEVGTAIATGKLGPHGHEVYEINQLVSGGVNADHEVGALDAYHDFVEVPPAP